MDSSGDGVGDLQGIISKLDYLNNDRSDSLGVDAVWFSPFFKSPNYDYGYDISDYCDIDPSYGTLADFDQLIEEAHKRNIMIILDLVVNHSSYLHPWFIESKSSKNNPKRDWYIWKDGRGGKNRPPNNWRNHFFGSAWTWDEKTGQYYLHSFLPEQPDLNWENAEVLDAVGDVIRFWLDRGVDGFRLDVAHHYCKDQQFRNNPPFFFGQTAGGIKFTDRSFTSNLMRFFSLPTLQRGIYNQHQPKTHFILKKFREIFNQYSARISIGEILGDNPKLIASYYGRNHDELHMNFYFELLNCRWKAGSFRRCIESWEKNLPENDWPAHTLSNHDVMRAVSRYGGDDNGDRKAKLLMLMLLSLRGTPFIYYGEELAMQEAKLSRFDLKDPVGKKWYPLHRGRDGCRTPMQWDSTDRAGFSTSEPWLPLGSEADRKNVEEMEKDPCSVLNFTRDLIWLRKQQPALLKGIYESITIGVPKDCFCFFRQSDSQRVAVFLNFSAQKKEIDFPRGTSNYRILISTYPDRKKGNNMFPLTMDAYEGCIVARL